MGKTVHGDASSSRLVAAPKLVRITVLAVEVGLVVLLAYLLAQLSFKFFEERSVTRVVPQNVAAAQTSADYSLLSSFDPFYRQIANRPVQQQSVGAIPESSLRIEVFGLRATGDGAGSAIVKMQDSDQKLVQVGEIIVRGVTLSGVYVDRLEISRGGIREAVYLRPQSARAARTAQAPVVRAAARQPSTGQADAVSAIVEQLLQLDLQAVRRNRRIIGFRLPEGLPAAFQLAGLEAQDILLAVNGSPMASYERIEEIAEEAAGAAQLNIEVERRGERRQLSLNLKGTG